MGIDDDVAQVFKPVDRVLALAGADEAVAAKPGANAAKYSARTPLRIPRYSAQISAVRRASCSRSSANARAVRPSIASSDSWPSSQGAKAPRAGARTLRRAGRARLPIRAPNRWLESPQARRRYRTRHRRSPHQDRHRDRRTGQDPSPVSCHSSPPGQPTWTCRSSPRSSEAEACSP